MKINKCDMKVYVVLGCTYVRGNHAMSVWATPTQLLAFGDRTNCLNYAGCKICRDCDSL